MYAYCLDARFHPLQSIADSVKLTEQLKGVQIEFNQSRQNDENDDVLQFVFGPIAGGSMSLI